MEDGKERIAAAKSTQRENRKMILMLDKNDVEKRALECAVSVQEVLTSFPREFRSEDYAHGFFAGLTQGSIKYVLYDESSLLFPKYNDALQARKEWSWYMVQINIVANEE